MRASRQSTQFSISVADRKTVGGVARHEIVPPSGHAPALVPAIHVFMVTILQDVDARDKRGHDDVARRRQVMPRLAGKTAIVTGGAKGIGRHYSQALAAEGARVMIADIADGRELAEEIAGRHGANSVASVTFDVSDEKAVKGLVARDHRALRPDRCAGEQCRALFRAEAENFQRMGHRAVGSRDGDQRARDVSDGAPCRAAHDGAAQRQDHQHRLGRSLTKACRACCLT